MICFRDMTFCSAPCQTRECPRRWTPELAAQARAWWKGPDVPVAFQDFSRACPDYAPAPDAAPPEAA